MTMMTTGTTQQQQPPPSDAATAGGAATMKGLETCLEPLVVCVFFLIFFYNFTND